MKYRVCIRNNATGEERLYQDPFNWGWTGGADPDLDRIEGEARFLFMYTDGNYGCDCNRELFFLRAAGEPEPASDDSSCGYTRFSVPWAEREDGTRLEIDTPDETPPA